MLVTRYPMLVTRHYDNCNPETVSTDYDTSDRLYFEPLTDESVISVIKREAENGHLLGVIVLVDKHH